jgi:hypothetical protein
MQVMSGRQEPRDVRRRDAEHAAEHFHWVAVAELVHEVDAAISAELVDPGVGNLPHETALFINTAEGKRPGQNPPHPVVPVGRHRQEQPVLDEAQEGLRPALLREMPGVDGVKPAVIEQGRHQLIAQHLDAAMTAGEGVPAAEQSGEDGNRVSGVLGAEDVEHRKVEVLHEKGTGRQIDVRSIL